MIYPHSQPHPSIFFVNRETSQVVGTIDPILLASVNQTHIASIWVKDFAQL